MTLSLILLAWAVIATSLPHLKVENNFAVNSRTPTGNDLPKEVIHEVVMEWARIRGR